MYRLTPVVKNLLIINVIVFFGLNFALSQFEFGNYLVLQGFGKGFMPHQLITSMFLHANIGHLFSNMLALFFLGPMVEGTLNSKRFLTLYMVAGIVGGLVFLLTTNGSAIGASGAVNGVAVAFAAMFPNMKLMVFPLPFEIKAKYLITAFVFIDFYYGVTSYDSGIAHFAHLGGAAVGFILVYIWRMNNLR